MRRVARYSSLEDYRARVDPAVHALSSAPGITGDVPGWTVCGAKLEIGGHWEEVALALTCPRCQATLRRAAGRA